MSKELTNTDREVLEELLQYQNGLGIRELSLNLHRGYPSDFDYPDDSEEPEESEWDMSGPSPKETKKAVESLLTRGLLHRDSKGRYYVTRKGAGALLRSLE